MSNSDIKSSWLRDYIGILSPLTQSLTKLIDELELVVERNIVSKSITDPEILSYEATGATVLSKKNKKEFADSDNKELQILRENNIVAGPLAQLSYSFISILSNIIIVSKILPNKKGLFQQYMNENNLSIIRETSELLLLLAPKSIGYGINKLATEIVDKGFAELAEISINSLDQPC